MADINLLREKSKGFLSEEHVLLFFRVAAVILVVLVLSLSILFFFLSRDPAIAQQNADKANTLAQLTLLHSKTAKYLILIDRTNKIQMIKNSQVSLSPIMTHLVKEIPSGATITDFSLDQKTFSISISSTDLSLLGLTVDNFSPLVSSGKTIKDVTIQGIVSDEKSQIYVLTLSGDLL